MYRRVTCYHYMGVWSYNSWIRSNWIHWKSRYIPIRNRGNSDGPEHCLWRTGAWASYCLWMTWTSWRKWHAYCTGFKGSAWRTLLYIYRRMLIICKYSLYVIVLCILYTNLWKTDLNGIQWRTWTTVCDGHLATEASWGPVTTVIWFIDAGI